MCSESLLKSRVGLDLSMWLGEVGGSGSQGLSITWDGVALGLATTTRGGGFYLAGLFWAPQHLLVSPLSLSHWRPGWGGNLFCPLAEFGHFSTNVYVCECVCGCWDWLSVFDWVLNAIRFSLGV